MVAVAEIKLIMGKKISPQTTYITIRKRQLLRIDKAKNRFLIGF